MHHAFYNVLHFFIFFDSDLSNSSDTENTSFDLGLLIEPEPTSKPKRSRKKEQKRRPRRSLSPPPERTERQVKSQTTSTPEPPEEEIYFISPAKEQGRHKKSTFFSLQAKKGVSL